VACALTGGTSGGSGSADTDEVQLRMSTNNSSSDIRGAWISALNTTGASQGHDLLFYTNPASSSPVEVVRIDSTGSVGIGTATPTEKLEVNGNVKGTSFIGNVTGNVTGNLTGNADTATSATSATNATNADTVDNLHAASFLRADANDTASGAITFNGVVSFRNAIDLADNDILRFGSGDDAEFFTNGSHMYLDLNGGINNFYIRDGTTTRFTFDDAGHFTASGNIRGTLNNGDVRTAIASSGVGNVGTYAFCTLRNSNADRAAGYTTSGSNLRYSNANANVSGTPNGSWRLMGRLAGSSSNAATSETSLWLRYA
jgi:hypothetical protein